MRSNGGVVAALAVILLAACGSNGFAGQASPSAQPVFQQGSGDWHPFSPQFVMFRHVESDVSAGPDTKTYVDVADANVFSKVFGNVLLNGLDPAVAGLASRENRPSPVPMVVTNSQLVRLNSPESAVAAVRETLGRYDGETSASPAIAEIWLFPRADQLDSYVTALGGTAPGLAVASKSLGQGCVLTRLTKPASSAELAVLAMQAPDKAISWADARDRACLVAFFAESFGVRPAAVNGLMPAAASGQDCTLARILRPDQRTSAYRQLRYQTNCPAAPVRRAASLVWYAQHHGAGLDPRRSADLVATVKRNCTIMREQDIAKDESCSAVLQGAQ